MVEKRPSGSKKRLSCTSSLHMLTSPSNTGPVPGSTLLETIEHATPEHGRIEVLSRDEPRRFPPIEGFRSVPLTFGSDLPRLSALVDGGAIALAGPGSIHVAHTLDEHIDAADLSAGIDLNARLVTQFRGAKHK